MCKKKSWIIKLFNVMVASSIFVNDIKNKNLAKSRRTLCRPITNVGSQVKWHNERTTHVPSYM